MSQKFMSRALMASSSSRNMAAHVTTCMTRESCSCCDVSVHTYARYFPYVRCPRFRRDALLTTEICLPRLLLLLIYPHVYAYADE